MKVTIKTSKTNNHSQISEYSDVDSGCYDDFIQESGNRE